MAKLHDLTNMKFGRLTVIERDKDKILPSGQHQTMWRCKCDCGNITSVRGVHLKSGKTKSCGCYNREEIHKRTFKDLTGIRLSDIGIENSKLTVIKRAEDCVSDNGNRSATWLCKCDCGNETVIRTSSLLSGHTKTCGHCGFKTIENTRILDLSDLKFGDLKVDSMIVSEDKNVSTKWLCSCECGNQTIVSTSNLISGHTCSCGHCGFDTIENTRQIDLTGLKFNRLTVKNKIDSLYWLCQCECGNEVKVTTTKLINGYKKSCGCLQKEIVSKIHLVDLTGWVMKEHGVQDSRLTVIKRVEDYIQPNGKSVPQYLCRCECGNECIVNANYLKTGHTKSCGCYCKERISETCLKNLSGMRFDSLVVCEQAKSRTSKRRQTRTYWKCVCDCGNNIEVNAHSLISGRQISCGCMKSHGEYNVIKYLKENNIDYIYQKRFDNLCGLGGKPLSYDFYIPECNLLIECQGQQHYNPIDFFGGDKSYLSQNKHDELKREYALRHGYTLLEIKYDDYNNVDDILNKKIIGGNL